MTDGDPRLTDKQAADYAGVSARTIRRWRRTGELPFYRKGRTVRIRRSDLDKYLEQFRVNTVSRTPAGTLRLMLQQISDRILPRKEG
jgi:excisionase family DNA binding protein